MQIAQIKRVPIAWNSLLLSVIRIGFKPMTCCLEGIPNNPTINKYRKTNPDNQSEREGFVLTSSINLSDIYRDLSFKYVKKYANHEITTYCKSRS